MKRNVHVSCSGAILHVMLVHVCVRVGKHQQRISVIFGIGPARCRDTCTYCNRHFGLISSPSEWTCRREAGKASKATGWLFVRSTTSYPLPSTIPRFQTTCHCLYFPFLLYWTNASLSHIVNYINFSRNKSNQPSPRRPRRHPWLLTPISRWPHSMYVSFFFSVIHTLPYTGKSLCFYSLESYVQVRKLKSTTRWVSILGKFWRISSIVDVVFILHFLVADVYVQI